VLVSLSPDNYPFGLKDIIPDGDLPVVWINTNYRMIYMNMGHGDKIFTDATQNKLIIAGLRWVVATDKKGNVFGGK
jgi:type 1 glutamine amidotransferase